MFAYCGNNPVTNIDPSGMFFERTAGGGGGGGLAYAGPASGHIVRPTIPLSIPLGIPFIPPSTTYYIESLRAEIIAMRKSQVLEEAQVVVITVPTIEERISIAEERVSQPIGRRKKFNSRKKAREAAKRAGGGKEPIHHPKGCHGNKEPHYHPDVKDRYRITPNGVSSHDHYYYPR